MNILLLFNPKSLFQLLDGIIPFVSFGTSDGILVAEKTYLRDSLAYRLCANPFNRHEIFGLFFVVVELPVIIGLHDIQQRPFDSVNIHLELTGSNSATSYLPDTDIPLLRDINPHAVSR